MRKIVGFAALCALVVGCSSSSNNGSDSDAGSGGNDAGTGDSGASDGGAPNDGGGGTLTFKAITLPDDADSDNERVTGIGCSAVSQCAIATDPFGEAGHIYSTDGKTVAATAIITGDTTYASTFGTVGTMSFSGMRVVGSRVIALTIGAESAFISATGDVTQTASWTGVVAGTSGTGGTSFALNTQYGIGTDGTKWVMTNAGRVWQATAAVPAAAVSWTDIFSPQAVPAIPADIADQKSADATICNTDPSVSISPALTQGVYVAADLSLIVYPAGAVNQNGDDTAGVCISTDGGVHFHHSAFAGLNDGQGPVGVTCTSKDHCVAYGGIQNNDGTAVVFVTSNASSGKDSTWTKATTPTVAGDTGFRSVAFAPDGKTGWLVGNTASNGSLVFTTSDGGASWTDITSSVKGVTGDHRLHTVYAFDATHVFIGGENSTLVAAGY